MSANSDLGFDANAKSAEMDKYSRQVGAYGVGVMKFLRNTDVLVIGLKGVGVEAAKDLILTGARGVDVYDSGKVEVADLGTNFFFTADDIGKPRTCCADNLQELNDDVKVKAVEGDITEEVLKNYQGVIVTDASIPYKTLCAWNQTCRSAGIPFLLAVTHGLVGSIFVDFGDKHTVKDRDGEPHKFVAIQKLYVEQVDGKSVIRVKLDDNHGMEDGDQVQFEDVQGVPELSQGTDPLTKNALPSKPFEVKRVYHKYKDDKGNNRSRLIPDVLEIVTDDDVTKWGKYESSGFVREVKEVFDVSFKSLADAGSAPVTHPHTMRALMSNAGASVLLAQHALWRFLDNSSGELPKLHDADDAAKLIALAKEINEENKKDGGFTVDQIDEEMLKKVSMYARAEISGYSAFLGGVIAQEIIKASGKWTPIQQWVVVDSLDLLKAEVPADAKPAGNRYDHQVSLFGQSFQDKIMNQRWFLVGCGALGCEYMKAFALMGVGSGDKGELVCTDMDTIEVSNLARQFLFRRRHVHKPKSTCAAETARKMNPDMKIKVYGIKVAPSTENVFNDAFWTSIDGVCNALDNVKARLYMDSRCVFFHRPLLESGTLGTKANNDVIVPKLTQSFTEGHVEVKEKFVPQCTMKNFPYMIEHTIGWAGRAGQFNDLFVTPATDLKNAVEDPAKLFEALDRVSNQAERKGRLEAAKKLLKFAEDRNFNACVALAFEYFIKRYRDDILNLTHHFPEDATKKDEETGEEVPFWSAPKRFPHAAQWDPKNPEKPHLDYLYNTANLFAHMFNVDHVRDEEKFKELVVSLNLTPPEWKPASKAALGEVEEKKPDDSGAASSSDAGTSDDGDDAKAYQELKTFFESYDYSKLRAADAEIKKADPNSSLVRPADFEKDDDTNFHIDFVTSASNLRASNYYIKPATRHQTKMTAGRIIPAIATTTAMITGLNSIEFYKILMGLEIESYCNSNVNLGVAQFSQFEPTPPGKAQKEYSNIEMCDVVPVPEGFTVWDQVVVDKGDLTVKEFVAQFPEVHHGCVPNQISAAIKLDGDDQTKFIYMALAPTAGLKERNASFLDKKVTEVYKEVYGELPAANYLLLDISCDKDDDPVKIPNPVVYKYK